MVVIVSNFTNSGVPLVSPATAPTIRIRRLDTDALVVTDDAMTEVGDGSYRYSFTTAGLLEYSVRTNGDPIASGQTTLSERYQNAVIGDDIVRKVFINRAETIENAGPTPPAGSQTINFYDDDQSTVIESITISTDGNTRINP